MKSVESGLRSQRSQCLRQVELVSVCVGCAGERGDREAEEGTDHACRRCLREHGEQLLRTRAEITDEECKEAAAVTKRGLQEPSYVLEFVRIRLERTRALRRGIGHAQQEERVCACEERLHCGAAPVEPQQPVEQGSGLDALGSLGRPRRRQKRSVLSL